MFASHLIGPVAKFYPRQALVDATYVVRLTPAERGVTFPTAHERRATRGSVASALAALACALTLALGPYKLGITNDGPIVDLFDVAEAPDDVLALADDTPERPIVAP